MKRYFLDFKARVITCIFTLTLLVAVFRFNVNRPGVSHHQNLIGRANNAVAEGILLHTRHANNYTYVPSRIAVIQFTDKKHFEANTVVHKSMECYAKSHGYDHIMFDPNVIEPCRKGYSANFFYRQLCALEYVMELYEDEYDYFAKFDGDVVGGTSERSLDKWIDGADIIMQNRYLTGEVNAGFYILRNTEVARNFVKLWGHHSFVRDSVAMGSDNGSNVLALLDILQLKDRDTCYEMWKKAADIGPFMKFQGCARERLGPPRRHRYKSNHYDEEVRVTIWPALMGPMIDPVVIGLHLDQSRSLWPIHHGIKNTDTDYFKQRYGDPSRVGIPDADGRCVDFNAPGIKNHTDHNDDLLMKVARGWTTPAKSIDDIWYHATHKYYKEWEILGFNSPDPLYHWFVTRWDLDGLPDCTSYDNCQPLGPRETFTGSGWKMDAKDGIAELKGVQDATDMWSVEVPYTGLPLYEENHKSVLDKLLLESRIELTKEDGAAVI